MMWYKQELKELEVYPLEGAEAISITLRSDNQNAIDLINNLWISDYSYHIDIQYYYIQERVYARDFSIVYVPTRDNLAENFMKALPKVVHCCLLSSIRNSASQ